MCAEISTILSNIIELLLPKLKQFNFQPPWPKKHCPFCTKSNVKKNGSYTNGTQRWYCQSCRRSFSWKIPANKHLQEKIWFKHWIAEGFSVRQLQYLNEYSSSKIRRIINRYLNTTPKQPNSLENHSNLIFDGTYLHQRVSVIVLMSAEKHTVIAGHYKISENSKPQLRTFFEPLIAKGLRPSSCTVDGNPHVIATLKTLWPDIIIQRCLVHIQRQGLMWCRQNPQRPDAKELRDIFLQVPYIKSHEQRDILLSQIQKWELRWGIFIDAQPERGKVFSDLKRARSMLLKAIPNMFHFLNDPSIPPTTNGLEGYFARLKQRYRNHRGLTPSKCQNYFQWYFNLCPH